MTAALLCIACSGPAPAVPPAQPVTDECQVLDPPSATQAAAQPASMAPAGKPAKKGLAGLLPGAGVARGPLKLGQILSLHTPPSDVQWRALPPSADAALATIAQDATEAPTTRARAISGLAVRGSDGAPGVLKGLLLTEGEPAVQRAAARALADRFIEPEGGEVMAALSAAAASDAPRLREAVIKAVAPHAAQPAVERLLKARLAVETEPLIREAIEQALTPATPE